MAYLQSDSIETIAYDEAAHRLRAKFRGENTVFVYENVPQEVYDGLLFAESITAYFRAHIEGRYPAHRA